MPNKAAVKTSKGRTFERQTFLCDVLTTALEGGIGYWCRVDSYWWFSPELPSSKNNRVQHETVDGVEFPNAWAKNARDTEDPESEPWGDITVETIATGIARILAADSKISLASDYVGRIAVANRNNDAGEIDALDADAIVQAGLLGDVVYG
jgi:hypothetical protein